VGNGDIAPLFVTSALDGGELSASTPHPLPIPLYRCILAEYSLDKTLGSAQRTPLRQEKAFVLEEGRHLGCQVDWLL
jgi:hypothetical protein